MLEQSIRNALTYLPTYGTTFVLQNYARHIVRPLFAILRRLPTLSVNEHQLMIRVIVVDQDN